MKCQRDAVLALAAAMRDYANAASTLTALWDLCAIEFAKEDLDVLKAAAKAQTARAALFSAYADAILSFSTCHTPGSDAAVSTVRTMLSNESTFVTMIDARYIHTASHRMGAWANDPNCWTDAGHLDNASIQEAS